jgi:hypothetical protein
MTTKDPYPDISDKYDARIREALDVVWENVRRSESLANLEYIIETQGIAGLLPILETLPDELSAQLRPVIEDAIAESGRVVVQVLPKAAVTGPVVFSLVTPQVSTYIYKLSLYYTQSAWQVLSRCHKRWVVIQK